MSATNGPSADRRLLRWYPPRWRERYGDELLALVEDQTGGLPPGAKMRAEIACAGLRQRARDAALVGDRRPRSEQMWTGALTVLVGWAAFLLGGASFQRQSEHFIGGVPAGARAVPVGAFDTIRVLALLGGAIVILGALATLPAFLQMVRRGGWRDLRRRTAWAAGTSAACAGSVLGLAAWAHSLDSTARQRRLGRLLACVCGGRPRRNRHPWSVDRAGRRRCTKTRGATLALVLRVRAGPLPRARHGPAPHGHGGLVGGDGEVGRMGPRGRSARNPPGRGDFVPGLRRGEYGRRRLGLVVRSLADRAGAPGSPVGVTDEDQRRRRTVTTLP